MINLKNVNQELKKEGIKIEYLHKSKDKFNTLRLINSQDVELSNGDIITIPENFTYDGPSTLKVVSGLLFVFAALLISSFWFIPFLMKTFVVILLVFLQMVIFFGTDKSAFPGLVHDYLYKEKCQDYSQEFCDKEFYLWLKATNGTNKISTANITNWLLYQGVKLAGKLVFCRNK